ncbi:MAG TPA: hypothetical protein VN428_02410 [Bryobacteraceae bacterium]|nr:hypothetical protein [Bryobacteraceae bacterium]
MSDTSQIILTKEETAAYLEFSAACKARAEGYAAAMKDASDLLIRQIIAAKKTQEGTNGSVSSADEANQQNPARQ